MHAKLPVALAHLAVRRKSGNIAIRKLTYSVPSPSEDEKCTYVSTLFDYRSKPCDFEALSSHLGLFNNIVLEMR